MAGEEQYSEAFLHESKQGLVVGIAAFFITLDTVCVFLRFLSKHLGRLRLGWDDVLIVLGLIICAGEVTCTLLDVRYGGIGLHEARVKQIDPNMLTTWGKFLIIIPIFYFSTVVPPKLVILHLYLSIFTDSTLRKICWGTVAVVIGNWIAVFITGFLACIPISYFWTGVGHCIDTNSYLRWGGFANILTDLVMLVLPIPVVWSLHTSTRLKVGILATLLLGSLGLIASVVRFIEFYVTDSGGDVTWNGSNLEIWATIEGGIYMVAACLPMYRPLLRFVSRRFRGESQGGSTSQGYGGGSVPFTGTAKSDNRGPRELKHVSLKYSQMNHSMDEEEDAVRLVNLKHDRLELGPGAIVVDSEFTVH